MMDMRNSRGTPRELYENTFPRRGFRGARGMRADVPAGRFQNYAVGMNGEGITGPEAEENGGIGPLQYEPEDGRAVPIADPPAPEEIRITGEENGSPGACGGTDALMGWPLAMVYAPDQVWRELYGDEEALGAGTLFRELDLPFCPGCARNGR